MATPSLECAKWANHGAPGCIFLLYPQPAPAFPLNRPCLCYDGCQMAESITTAESSLGYKVVRYWVPVIVMLALMYWFSTDALSGENTRGIIETVLSWFGYRASPRQLTRINYFVRKGAHFTEYAILAALLFRAFRADSPLRWRLRWSVYSLGVALVWAALDELHQSFTRTRGGSVYDSLLDSSGAFFMLVGIAIVSRRSDKAVTRAAHQ